MALHELDKYNVSTVIARALRARKSNQETLDEVKRHFPNSSTNIATVNWYRGRLRKAGEDIPTARELKREAKDFDAMLYL